MASPSSEFRRLTTLKYLQSIYYEQVANRSSRGRDGVTPLSLESDIAAHIVDIQRRLRRGAYQFVPYRQVLKLKGADSAPRSISLPSARDRIVHRVMADLLRSQFETPQLEKPQFKVRRLRETIESGRFDYVIRLDITNFYPSIRHDLLLDTVRMRIRQPHVLELFHNAIDCPTVPDHASSPPPRCAAGVPQGLSISNLLAEVFLSEFDRLQEHNPDIAYFRYVDDIVVLCRRDDSAAHINNLDLAISDLDLKIHPLVAGSSKSSAGPLTTAFDFLGYRFDSGLVTVRSANRHRLERAIARVFTRYKYSISSPRPGQGLSAWPARCLEILIWYLNLMVYGYTYKGVRHGWVIYFSQINDLTLLKKFDLLVIKFAEKLGIDIRLIDVSFVSAYWGATRRGSRNRIQNFDTLSRARKKEILHRVYFVSRRRLSAFSDVEVDAAFNARIERISIDIEKDIGTIS